MNKINNCTECPYCKTCTNSSYYGLTCKFRIEEEEQKIQNRKVKNERN